MFSTRFIIALAVCAVLVLPVAGLAADIRGDYLETRTCDVFTGPCFANAQVGLTGKEAMLAWSIDQGTHRGVELGGLKVVALVMGSDTLGFGGGLVVNPEPIRAALIVDAKATASQREALIDFVKTQAPRLMRDIVEVRSESIDMNIDHVAMVATLKAGNRALVKTRKLTHGDCVCTNEELYYPPLVKVHNAAAAYTVDGKFSAPRKQWSQPSTRSAYLATFAY